MRTWLLTVAAVAVLGAGGLDAGTASAGPGVARSRVAARTPSELARGERVAQVPSRVDLAIANVARAQRVHGALVSERAAATRRYDAELAEIDQLKRQKASWRRDRALRSRLASSLETVKLLTSLADKVRRADLDVTRAKATAVAIIDAALPTATAARKLELSRRRAAWVAPRAAKKIILPDAALDPLADPEELDEQAAALRDAEAALTAEVTRLEQRTTRFDEMAELRRQHDRAESMVRVDDEEIRRVAIRSGTSEADVVSGAPPLDDGNFGEGPRNRDIATVLSDVVDARTVDVLRSSDRSSDPSTWAAASRQAKDAVTDRLAKLRKQRAAIEARARELRQPSAARP